MSSLKRILIVNPNTSSSMTEALKAPIQALGYNDTIYTYSTNPSPEGPASINSTADAELSTSTILPFLQPLLEEHDAFLVACFSPHPLVRALRELVGESSRPRKPVTGIFEASISAATEHTAAQARWAIVTTAETWREPLAHGVGDILGVVPGPRGAWDHRESSFALGSRFGGVETTGLTAGELHSTPREVVDQRMAEALGRLVDLWESKAQRLGAVVLGCAGMVGWEEKIRGEMRRRHPGDARSEVLVIDPVKAGIGSLQNALRADF